MFLCVLFAHQLLLKDIEQFFIHCYMNGATSQIFNAKVIKIEHLKWPLLIDSIHI